MCIISFIVHVLGNRVKNYVPLTPLADSLTAQGSSSSDSSGKPTTHQSLNSQQEIFLESE